MIRYAQAVRNLVGDKFIGGPADGPVNEIKFKEGTTPPTEEEIQAKLKELEKQYADNEYQRKRLQEYPSIQELVVALYDADDKAEIDKKRAEIKKKYPKPE